MRSYWRQSSALHAHAEQNLNGAAVQATAHCLVGCALGEIVGMAIATAFGWPNGVQIVLAIALAFAFGYALTMRPVLRAGVPFPQASRIALASDTVSISVGVRVCDAMDCRVRRSGSGRSRVGMTAVTGTSTIRR